MGQYDIKIQPGQKVCYVLGDKKNQCIVVAECDMIMISERGVSYLLKAGMIVHSKSRPQDVGQEVACCHVKNEFVDTGEKGLCSWATFTTKKGCLEWLKQK